MFYNTEEWAKRQGFDIKSGGILVYNKFKGDRDFKIFRLNTIWKIFGVGTNMEPRKTVIVIDHSKDKDKYIVLKRYHSLLGDIQSSEEYFLVADRRMKNIEMEASHRIPVNTLLQKLKGDDNISGYVFLFDKQSLFFKPDGYSFDNSFCDKELQGNR
ncbi:hypothetical protein OAQ84_00930 [Bdellovibrionales bacterium]|nr:hypothetical protein [Bdellovibrionales bacterium]